MDYLLHPDKDIDDSEAVEWCKWLVGGGRTPDDFSVNVQEYNNTVMCGLVWTANFVAFRCQTCRISQCMSLCAECFRHGNHEGHDYNMFRSQAGGACDCGDPSVMRESGFCSRVKIFLALKIFLTLITRSTDPTRTDGGRAPRRS